MILENKYYLRLENPFVSWWR